MHHIEYDNELVALPVSKVGETPDYIGAAALEGASLSHTVRQVHCFHGNEYMKQASAPRPGCDRLYS